MRQIHVLLLSLLIAAQNTWGQKMPQDYFEEAQAKAFQKNDSAALIGFNYLVEHYPKSKYCSTAYYNIGNIYSRMGEDRKTIQAYRMVVFGLDGKQLNKNSIISAYDNKISAANQLSTLYEKMANYDSALYFLYIYDTGFAKIYGCGTEADLAQDRTVARYANLYLKTGRVQEAEKALLSMHVFKWYKYDGEVATRLEEMFKKYEKPATLKSQIDIAVDHYFIDTEYHNQGGTQYSMVYCCLRFLGAKVRFPVNGIIPDDSPFGDGQVRAALPAKEAIIASLKKSELYQLIQLL